MGFTLKNERVHDLAREAARVTGKSQTGAVEEALERPLQAYDADPGAARVARTLDVVRGLVDGCAADAASTSGDTAIRAVENLYENASGMPR